MLSFLRCDVPKRTTTAHLNPITYESGRSKQLFHRHTARYMMTHSIPPSTPSSEGKPAFRSMFNPPLHFHMYQREEFHVQSGHARFYISGATHSRHADESIFIPVEAYHRFENASPSEDLIVDIALDPRDAVMEERFFRNFFAYLGDCKNMGRGPSIFQLLLFLYTVDGPLAVPIPGRLGRGVSWFVMFVAGVVVGEWLLGYRRSYREYYVEEGTGKEL